MCFLLPVSGLLHGVARGAAFVQGVAACGIPVASLPEVWVEKSVEAWVVAPEQVSVELPVAVEASPGPQQESAEVSALPLQQGVPVCE